MRQERSESSEQDLESCHFVIGDLGLFSTYARGYVVGLGVGHVLGESSLS